MRMIAGAQKLSSHMKEKISSLTSDTISALRFPLSLGVVFIHFNILSDALAVRGTGSAGHFPEWLTCVVTLFSDILARLAVPLFFIISGYLFFRADFTLRSYKEKLRKRARTILVPYVLWNVIAVITVGVKFILPGLNQNKTMPTIDWSLPAMLACFYDKSRGIFQNPEGEISTYIYPQDFPLWFVRDLMLMFILAPLLYWMLKKSGWLAVAVLGFLNFASHVFHDHMTIYVPQFLVAIFYFSWGACYGLKGMDMVESMRRHAWAALLYPLWAVAVMLTVGNPYNICIREASLIFGIFAAVVLTARLLERGTIRVNKFLSDGSFFLYALHGLLIAPLGRCVTKAFYVDNALYMTALYFLVPLSTTAISYVLYRLLRRYAPRICDCLTGGR